MTSTDDAPLVTCRPTSPITNISSLPTGHLYTALAPSYIANTSRLAPPGLRSDFSQGSSSSSILPPQISPSLLIPLRDTPPSPLSPASNTGDSSTNTVAASSSLQQQQQQGQIKSDYQLALERLEQANLQDTQMLSSFKRKFRARPPSCSRHSSSRRIFRRHRIADL